MNSIWLEHGDAVSFYCARRVASHRSRRTDGTALCLEELLRGNDNAMICPVHGRHIEDKQETHEVR